VVAVLRSSHRPSVASQGAIDGQFVRDTLLEAHVKDRVETTGMLDIKIADRDLLDRGERTASRTEIVFANPSDSVQPLICKVEAMLSAKGFLLHLCPSICRIR